MASHLLDTYKLYFLFQYAHTAVLYLFPDFHIIIPQGTKFISEICSTPVALALGDLLISTLYPRHTLVFIMWGRGRDKDDIALSTIEIGRREKEEHVVEYDFKPVQWKDFVTKKKYIRE